MHTLRKHLEESPWMLSFKTALSGTPKIINEQTWFPNMSPYIYGRFRCLIMELRGLSSTLHTSGIQEPMPRPSWDPKLRTSSAHMDSFLRRLYDRKRSQHCCRVRHWRLAETYDLDNEKRIQLMEAARGNFCDLGGLARRSPQTITLVSVLIVDFQAAECPPPPPPGHLG